MAMSTLSVEEENYVRMSLLLTAVSPRAVRCKFDKEFADLPRTIKKENLKLLGLKGRKVINQAQWKLLHPTNGVPDSKNFDVTLMICLIRNLTPINPPTYGFDCLPPPGEISDGADLARIKHYRNNLAHLDGTKIDTPNFTTAWTNVSDALGRLGGPAIEQKCKELKVKILDQSNKEILLDIKQSKEEIKELKDIQQASHTELETSYKSLETEHESLKTHHDSLKGGHDTLRTDHDDLRTDHDTLRTGHDALRTDHDTLKTGHDALRTDHDTLRTGHDTLRTGHDTLRTGHDTLRTDHDTLRTGHDTLRTDHDTLRTGYDALRTDHDTLRTDHDTLKTDHDTLRTDQEGLERSYLSLKTDHDDKKKEIEKLKAEQEDVVPRNIRGMNVLHTQ